MFRACKYETYDELMAAFIRDQTKRNLAGGKQVMKILSKAGVTATGIVEAVEEEGESDDEEDEDEDESEAL